MASTPASSATAFEKPSQVAETAAVKKPKTKKSTVEKLEKLNIDDTDKLKSYQLKEIYDTIENSNIFGGLSRTSEMRRSIKQKTEIEKWSMFNILIIIFQIFNINFLK